MKKIIYLLSLLLVLSFIGCSEEPQNVKYESASITVSYVSFGASGSKYGSEKAFSNEGVSDILTILNNSKWDESLCKCGYEYALFLDGMTLFYSYDLGIINDYDNDQNLTLSDEEKTYINSLIDELYK